METAAVPLHVLDTDVDILVSGPGAEAFARTVAQRWHLAVADLARRGGHEAESAEAPVTVEVVLGPAADGPAGDGPAGEASAGEGSAGQGTSRVADGVLRGNDERGLLQRLTQQVTRAVIGARTGDLLMLHAGALAHPESGAGIVFVAPGGTGKSTTCRVQGPGRAYLSDETVGIRRDGTVAPYLKPISTRRVDWSGVKDEVAPSTLGLAPPRVPVRVAGVVLLRREEGREGPPEITTLETLEALTDIAPETSGFMNTERPLTWLAELLESTGGARRVVYGGAEQLEELIDEVVGGGR